MTDYIKAAIDEIIKSVKPGEKTVIETSNEALHLDLETGEMVSDSFTTERIDIEPPGTGG
jgi:hypothetical protein